MTVSECSGSKFAYGIEESRHKRRPLFSDMQWNE
ncbi:MAG: hypothetical protein JWQ04_3442 [Pedosphaera sp.]|nr:hypothetical protein [Pedosphaera sp.]